MAIGLAHFVILSAILASAGIAVMLTRRNALGILIGVELLLNAGGINFVAFNMLAHSASADGVPLMDGVIFTLFIIVLAAAEAAVALAIFLNYYNTFRSIDVERATELQG